MHKTIATLATVGTLALATLVGASPANADSKGDGAPAITTVGMTATGYDESVAKANGFEIVRYPDGSWESVAVTPAAQEIEAQYGGAVLIDPNAPAASRVTVAGNCGTSWIEVFNSGSAKRLNTGYSVSAPVANRINWTVQIASLGGVPSYTWPPAPTGATWQGAFTFGTGGVGGFAYVTNSSSVLLINGTICSSGGPTVGY